MSVFSFLSGSLDFIRVELFLAASAGLVLLTFLLAVAIGKEFFVSATALDCAVFLAVAVLKKEFSDLDRALLFLGFTALAAAFYLLLCALEKHRAARLRKRAKKKGGEPFSREAYYTLPDRENAFLKERLMTGLSGRGDGAENSVSVTKDVKLGFVYGMISELKKAPLSAADRLETENLSELLQKYAEKETLSATELRGFNDSMAAVLKLSAKYAL